MHCSLNELEDAALTFPVLFQDVIYQVNRKTLTFFILFFFFLGGTLAVCSLEGEEEQPGILHLQGILYSLKLFPLAAPPCDPKSCIGVRTLLAGAFFDSTIPFRE